MGVKQIPRGMFFWPSQPQYQAMSPVEIVRMYQRGFAGVYLDEEVRAECQAAFAEANNGLKNASEICHQYNLADSGAGKLCFLWGDAAVHFPGVWPGAAQERGDCVSHGGKNSALLTLSREITMGLPDPVTGVVEGVPEVPEKGIREGGVSSEWLYWHRGYDGDGWMCDAVVKVMMRSGIMLKKAYPDLGIDLTDYTGRNAGLYGRRSPPEAMEQVGREHLIRTATPCEGPEETRDMLWNGYGIVDCGSEGYQSRRDANGVSRRSGSWAHSMVNGGFDDRDVAKQKYGEPLLAIGNSWGTWNSGPRDCMESASLVPPALKELWVKVGLVNAQTGNIMLPEGWFWTPWSNARNRYRVAMSSVNGWPSRVPNYMLI